MSDIFTGERARVVARNVTAANLFELRRYVHELLTMCQSLEAVVNEQGEAIKKLEAKAKTAEARFNNENWRSNDP
jgi:predicted RNase H-like nuclease (RuvC/YqgF family)